MNRPIVLALLAIALAGCQSAPKSSSSAPATPAATASGTEAVAAGAPQQIAELTDQKAVWECPNCGMTFDRAGACSMGDGELVEMKVDYICPADNKPVEHSGKCPRCPANARVEKTAIAAVIPPAATGK